MTDFDETAWWGDCCNTYHEETKQLVYAARMGLRANWLGAHPPTWDLTGLSIIDLGGGPTSLLLKCVNFSRAVVVDPGDFPAWVRARYEAHGVELWRQKAEDLPARLRLDFDEAWIYNTLQHVDDPEQVCARARQCASLIRIFEWVDIDPYPGHPHRLTQALLDNWLGAPGFVAGIHERGAVGRAYYSVLAAT